MNQTLALLLDAYRDLNSRKLFWITLVLSGAVMAAFAFVGVSGSDVTAGPVHVPVPDAQYVYKWVFSTIVVGIWLSWAAMILALISTAGLFPDLITGGTIDLYLSKPISRLRLFLTKYLTGLVFVTLQVSVFSVGSFLVFGFRGHQWKSSLFLAIPLEVCLFSYLFGFCVLLGVWTRSTVAAILLTVLLWTFFCVVQFGDSKLLNADILLREQVLSTKQTILEADAELAPPNSDKVSWRRITAPRERQNALDQLPGLEKLYGWVHLFYRINSSIKAVIPKTGETIDMLDRYLFSETEVAGVQQRQSERRREMRGNQPGMLGDEQLIESANKAEAETIRIQRTTSPLYVIGTSILCEAAVVAWAAWLFCRRDY